jgi:hypothetical protein
MATNYIYLLCEFTKTNEPIYKLGKSYQENLKCIQNHPNGTKLILQTMCENCGDTQKELVNLFKLNFKHRKDIGNEYFEGNCYEMIQIMTDYLKNIFEKEEDASEEEEEESLKNFLINNKDDFLKV